MFFNQIHPLTFTLFFFFSLFCKEGRREHAGEREDSSEHQEKRSFSPLLCTFPQPRGDGDVQPRGEPNILHSEYLTNILYTLVQHLFGGKAVCCMGKDAKKGLGDSVQPHPQSAKPSSSGPKLPCPSQSEAKPCSRSDLLCLGRWGATSCFHCWAFYAILRHYPKFLPATHSQSL